jgi:2-oxoglutarate ferredoxin oxidoreductase subunit gamma
LTSKIIIAGSGGQGILFFGKILVFASMMERKEATWFPSYGAEMRGGTANCTVIISDSMIGSPVVLNPDILVAMNKASLEKFQPCLKSSGLLMYDSSLVKSPLLRRDVRAIGVPATQVASSIGSVKSANMVMLGALIAAASLLRKSSIMKTFEGPSGYVVNTGSKMNTNSVLEGVKYVENTKG